jgi:hypothetical protein
MSFFVYFTIKKCYLNTEITGYITVKYNTRAGELCDIFIDFKCKKTNSVPNI